MSKDRRIIPAWITNVFRPKNPNEYYLDELKRQEMIIKLLSSKGLFWNELEPDNVDGVGRILIQDKTLKSGEFPIYTYLAEIDYSKGNTKIFIPKSFPTDWASLSCSIYNQDERDLVKYHEIDYKKGKIINEYDPNSPSLKPTRIETYSIPLTAQERAKLILSTFFRGDKEGNTTTMALEIDNQTVKAVGIPKLKGSFERENHELYIDFK